MKGLQVVILILLAVITVSQITDPDLAADLRHNHTKDHFPGKNATGPSSAFLETFGHHHDIVETIVDCEIQNIKLFNHYSNCHLTLKTESIKLSVWQPPKLS